jgi:putative transposase
MLWQSMGTDPAHPVQAEGFRTLRRYEGLGHARELTFSCFRSRPFLRSAQSRGWVVQAIQRSRERHGFQLLAWVIMPEHVHLLLLPQRGGPEIGPILKSIKQSVTRAANLHLRSTGAPMPDSMIDRAPNGTVVYRFWQRGAGYDRNLFTTAALHASIAYIHANPVRRGLCKAPNDWEWSGARAVAGDPRALLRLDKLPF